MIWQTSRRTFDLAARGLIMGIINVTPDSFSDGGSFDSAAKAIEHGLKLAEAGADILDIGGESTRPGSVSISAEEELRRVLPVVEALAGNTPAAISIDTSKSSVARAAISAGAEIINDITALRADPDLAALAAETRAGLVLMHMLGTPRTMQQAPVYHNVVADVLSFLHERAQAAILAGVPRSRIAIDPGIGFGKSVEHNLQLLAATPDFVATGYPVVLGFSRKSFLASAAQCAPMSDRDVPTAALTALTRRFGAHIFRVHAVTPNLHALHLTESILKFQITAASEEHSFFASLSANVDEPS